MLVDVECPTCPTHVCPRHFFTHFSIMSELSGESDQSQGQREGCCMISALCIPGTKWQYYGKLNGKHWPSVCHITAKEARLTCQRTETI